MGYAKVGGILVFFSKHGSYRERLIKCDHDILPKSSFLKFFRLYLRKSAVTSDAESNLLIDK